MHIVMASSEAIPFAKTGGLADVAGTLPIELAKRGHQCSVFLPAYRVSKHFLREQAGSQFDESVASLVVDLAGYPVHAWIHRVRLQNSPVDFYLVDQPMFYDRQGLYGDSRGEFGDNCARYCFFSRAVVEAIERLQLPIDIIHCHDWQTGLIPAYHRTQTNHHSWYKRCASVMTIHNMAYQGRFWGPDMVLTGLDNSYFHWEWMEYYGDLNLLKTGIAFADALTTVSPTYAQEIQSPPQGCGLEGVLRARAERLFGIVNGIDESTWNPASDPYLEHHYNIDTWKDGKAACKRSLQESLGLPIRPEVPLIGIVGRLAEQKGWDLILQLMQWWIDHRDLQWVILGSGEQRYADALFQLAMQRPDRVSLQTTFSDPLAHRIEAGADLFLMPSLYEPCGLNQLYSLRYGAVPVVRSTGGLADTVQDASEENILRGVATGFVFEDYKPEALAQATIRALDVYSQAPDVWSNIVTSGMSQDWSWAKSADAMLDVYEHARHLAKNDQRL
ncbi:MAG: glycogen synthase GlgA [Planctomycetota bacterium]|nr:MAG: glycogen synthase GlgA [Planctomycetota bacterium]